MTNLRDLECGITPHHAAGWFPFPAAATITLIGLGVLREFRKALFCSGVVVNRFGDILPGSIVALKLSTQVTAFEARISFHVTGMPP